MVERESVEETDRNANFCGQIMLIIPASRSPLVEGQPAEGLACNISGSVSDSHVGVLGSNLAVRWLYTCLLT